MSTAIFQTTRDALFVSFLIMAVEPRQDSPLRKAIIRIMQQLDSPTAQQRQWLEQLVGERSDAVNFGGLSADEIRAQCAMVTQAVKDHLPEPEMHVIQARFIPTAVEDLGRDENGELRQRFYFPRERTESIQWLGRWLQPSFPTASIFLLDHLVAKHMAERKEVRRTFRDLAEQLGGSHMKYSRPYPKVKEKLEVLEKLAINRLTLIFQESALGQETALIEEYQ